MCIRDRFPSDRAHLDSAQFNPAQLTCTCMSAQLISARMRDGGKFWRCAKDGCSGRIKTDDSNVHVFLEFRNQSYSHVQDPENVTVQQASTNKDAETSP